MESLLVSHITQRATELTPVDMMRVARVMLPVLKEQEKPFEQRGKVAMKDYISTGEIFSSKNWEGEDIFRNGIRLRFADYSAGVSIKDTILVSEGWAFLDFISQKLVKEDFYFRTGGIILIKSEDLFRVSYGERWIDFDPYRRLAVANAIDRGLFYRDEDILVKDNGSVYLIFDGDRFVVKEPLLLAFFLGLRCYE